MTPPQKQSSDLAQSSITKLSAKSTQYSNPATTSVANSIAMSRANSNSSATNYTNGQKNNPSNSQSNQILPTLNVDGLRANVKRLSFDKFVYMVAPLEENSDAALRTICYRHGADMTFTEMTRVQGLVKKNKSTWSRLTVYDDTPYMIQLLAGRESDVEKFLQVFEPPKSGCFYGFNLNMGCPSPEVISLGLGSAFMKRVAKAQRLIDIFRKYGYPVSLKIRLGLNAYEKEKKTYLNIIRATTPDFFIVHARHGAQTYSEPSDFCAYKEIVDEATKLGKIIVANGDIVSTEKVDFLKSVGVRGAMIGRGAVWNPAIFEKLKGANETQLPTIEALRKEYEQLADAYNSHPRYKANVLLRMGKNAAQLDKNLLI